MEWIEVSLSIFWQHDRSNVFWPLTVEKTSFHLPDSILVMSRVFLGWLSNLGKLSPSFFLTWGLNFQGVSRLLPQWLRFSLNWTWLVLLALPFLTFHARYLEPGLFAKGPPVPHLPYYPWRVKLAQGLGLGASPTRRELAVVGQHTKLPAKAHEQLPLKGD